MGKTPQQQTDVVPHCFGDKYKAYKTNLILDCKKFLNDYEAQNLMLQNSISQFETTYNSAKHLYDASEKEKQKWIDFHKQFRGIYMNEEEKEKFKALIANAKDLVKKLMGIKAHIERIHNKENNGTTWWIEFAICCCMDLLLYAPPVFVGLIKVCIKGLKHLDAMIMFEERVLPKISSDKTLPYYYEKIFEKMHKTSVLDTLHSEPWHLGLPNFQEDLEEEATVAAEIKAMMGNITFRWGALKEACQDMENFEIWQKNVSYTPRVFKYFFLEKCFSPAEIDNAIMSPDLSPSTTSPPSPIRPCTTSSPTPPASPSVLHCSCSSSTSCLSHSASSPTANQDKPFTYLSPPLSSSTSATHPLPSFTPKTASATSTTQYYPRPFDYTYSNKKASLPIHSSSPNLSTPTYTSHPSPKAPSRSHTQAPINSSPSTMKAMQEQCASSKHTIPHNKSEGKIAAETRICNAQRQKGNANKRVIAEENPVRSQLVKSESVKELMHLHEEKITQATTKQRA